MLENIVQASKDLEIVKIQKKQPKIRIFNVPKDYSEESFTRQLINRAIPLASEETKQNAFQSTRIIFKQGDRQGSRGVNWVLTVPPQVFHPLMRDGRVFSDSWQSFRVEEFLIPARCRHCQRFGHVAKHCRGLSEKAAPTCGYCSAEGHTDDSCPNKKESPCCANCKRAGKKTGVRHETNARDCPEYLRAKVIEQSKTDYNGE